MASLDELFRRHQSSAGPGGRGQSGWAWPDWSSSPVFDLVYNGVLGAGGDGSRVRCAQRLWSDGLSLGWCRVQVLTQQQPQLPVVLSEVVLVLPQSFSPQHSAVESPQQLLQLRELARHLEDRGRRSGGWASRCYGD